MKWSTGAAVRDHRNAVRDRSERCPQSIGITVRVRRNPHFDQLSADFDIFRIQLFNEFKKYVIANLIVAVVLIVVLIMISYKADDQISDTLSIVFVVASVFPAPLTLTVLWVEASLQLQPLKKRADDLERKALGRLQRLIPSAVR